MVDSHSLKRDRVVVQYDHRREYVKGFKPNGTEVAIDHLEHKIIVVADNLGIFIGLNSHEPWNVSYTEDDCLCLKYF